MCCNERMFAMSLEAEAVRVEDATADNAAGLLFADRPLTDPKDDVLGYAEFAENLAKAIVDMAGKDGLVIGLHGPWGSGKSTVLNFVEHYLQQPAHKGKVLVVRFNPWWFSGSDAVLWRFFEALSACIERSWGKRARKKLGAALEEYAAAVAPAAVSIPEAGKAAEAACKGLGWLGRRLSGRHLDPQSRRDAICKALLGQAQRVVVLIDELDRLTASEIREVFRVVRSVADFPNTIYLLAFDRGIVCEALKGVQAGAGEDYLEKVVQVPFDLPAVDSEALHRLLSAGLQTVLGETPPKRWDRTEWAGLLHDHVAHFIGTPRDVNRYLNSVRLAWSLVPDEVHPLDLLGVEALRVFGPPAYELVKANKDLFVGHAMDDQPATRAKCDEILKLIERPDEKEAVRGLLERLFPKVRAAYSNRRFAPDYEFRWRRELRVRSADIFDVYFRLTLAPGAISDAEIQALLERAWDPEAFGEALLAFGRQPVPAGRGTRVSSVLDRLRDYASELSPDQGKAVLRALFQVGDALCIPDDKRGWLESGNDDLMLGILARITGQAESQTERGQLLLEAMAKGRSLYMITYLVYLLGLEHGVGTTEAREPPEGRTVNGQDLQHLTGVALTKIEAAAKDGALASVPGLIFVLASWDDWGGGDAMRTWVAHTTREEEGFASLLTQCGGWTHVGGETDGASRSYRTLTLTGLRKFLPDLRTARDRARNLLNEQPSWLTDEHREILELLGAKTDEEIAAAEAEPNRREDAAPTTDEPAG